MKFTLAVAAFLGFASASDVVAFQQPNEIGDIAKCIQDVEGLIPGVEKVIADLKAGDQNKAIIALTLLLPKAEAAYADCTATAKPHIMHVLHKVNKFISKINVGDLPTCISDIEAMLPAVEKIIAEFKAGNYDAALADALTVLPKAEQAYSDCLSSAKFIGGRFKTALKDDPRREYYEKLGAEYASGFLSGTRVDRFDTIDLYNCLHREPTAVEYFYKADQELKYAFQKKDEREFIKAMDELTRFVVEMVIEDYPHTRTQVCKEFRDREAQWGDLKMIIDDLKNPETTLQVDGDHKIYFNKVHIGPRLGEVFEDYVQGNWQRVGYSFGDLLLDAAAHGPEDLFLQ